MPNSKKNHLPKNDALGCLILVILLFSACLPKQKVIRGKQAPQPRHIESAAPVKRSTSAEAYILRYKTIAVQEMEQYGIPASITLSQALLESGNGNSRLAQEANNHFGIKCTSTWQGRTVLKDDDRRDDCFRVYNNPEESFRDHSEFLLRKRYAPLFELDKNDYKGWAHGLKKAGYATNPRYAELLINLIERYELYRYDLPETKVEKIQREEKVLTEIVEKMPDEAKDAAAKPPVSMQIHEVKAGETLYSIAKHYNLTLEEVKTLNNITGEKIELGQLLLVSK